MADRALLDTNILVYAVESGGPAASKSQLARLAIGQPRACVSTQILGEFYAATTSARRASPLTHVEAVAWIQFWKRLEVLDVTVAHVDLAVEIVDDYR
ncbi:MAG TPA: PIN domain-containing protein, partial [Lacipirellulaceae bacterium]|nr:PIN domain-containing protein [Lacipirellulaceae bacterium]